MKDKISSQLLILGFECHPDEITELIGLQPSDVVMKGDIERIDPSGNNPPTKYKDNMWILRTTISPQSSLDEHLESILKVLIPKAEIIKSLAEQYETEVAIYGWSHDATRQAFHFESRYMKQMVELGVEFDIDIYPIEDDYLDEPGKIDELIARLCKLRALDAYQSSEHDEIKSIAHALAIFEDLSPQINDSLIPDLCWDALDAEDLMDRLEKIRTKYKRIENAFNESKYLTGNEVPVHDIQN